jgi:hypothetical protein
MRLDTECNIHSHVSVRTTPALFSGSNSMLGSALVPRDDRPLPCQGLGVIPKYLILHRIKHAIPPMDYMRIGSAFPRRNKSRIAPIFR